MPKKKIEDARERILSAAIELFSKEGFHGSKIMKISDMTGLSVGRIYLSFESKERILEEIFFEAWEAIEAKLVELSSTKLSNRQKLEEAVKFIIDTTAENNNIAKLILQEHRFWNSKDYQKLSKVVEEVNIIVKSIIEDGMKQNEFREDVYPEIAASSFIGSIWNILELWTRDYSQFDKKYILNQIMHLNISGIESRK